MTELRPATFRRVGRSLLAVSLIFAIASCSENKTNQCQKITTITQKIAKKSAEGRNSTDFAEVLKVADAFDEAAKSMRNLKIADPQLAQYQQGYGEIYQGNADITRQFIDVLQKKDIINARILQKRVRQLGQQEQTLSAEMNRYCHPD